MYNERCKISIRKYFHQKKKKKNIRIGKDDIATPHQLHTKRSRVRSQKILEVLHEILWPKLSYDFRRKKLTVKSTILLLEVDARFIAGAIFGFFNFLILLILFFSFSFNLWYPLLMIALYY